MNQWVPYAFGSPESWSFTLRIYIQYSGAIVVGEKEYGVFYVKNCVVPWDTKYKEDNEGIGFFTEYRRVGFLHEENHEG